MNKSKKVALLKGIAAGTRSINELQPLQIKHWHNKDGVYTLAETDIRLTEQEFNELEQKANTNAFHIVHVHSNIPIATSEDAVFM